MKPATVQHTPTREELVTMLKGCRTIIIALSSDTDTRFMYELDALISRASGETK